MSLTDPSQPELKLSRASLVIVVTCTMLATLLQTLDSTIANVALPYMQGTMGASQDEIDWVLTSYIVSAAIMTAPTGFLAGRFGRTRLFIVSIIGFTIASLLCGAAHSLGQIVVFRVVQGAFGASLVPLSQAVMFDIFPATRRGPAMALFGIGVQIGPVFGPILGGWLTNYYSWHWVFYVNGPVGVLAAIGLATNLKETEIRKSLRLEWIGFGALSLGVGALQLMLDRGEQQDWFYSPEIILEACLAGIGFYLFTVQSLLAPKPFLSPKLFKDLNFVVSVTLVFVVGLIIFATLALLAPFLQTLMNYPVVTAGLVLAPRGLGTMVSMLLAGQLLGRVDARALTATGFLSGAYALYLMSQWTTDVSEHQVVIAGLIQGFSIGMIFPVLSTIIFATLPVALRTEGAGIFSLMRNLGSSIGISVTGALLQTYTQVNHQIIAGAVTPFNRALQSNAPARYWNPTAASGAALLNQEINRQATLIAYLDDFKLMFVLSIISLPLILLIRPNRPRLPTYQEALVAKQAARLGQRKRRRFGR